MPRTHNDSWDLADSVGATATMVATSRALASQGPDALLDDPFADPLVRAVGLGPFVRILDGGTSFEDDLWLNRKTRTEEIAVRTKQQETLEHQLLEQREFLAASSAEEERLRQQLEEAGGPEAIPAAR